MAGLTRLKDTFFRLLSSSSFVALILSVLVIMIIMDLDRVTVTGKGLQISTLEKPDNVSVSENANSENDGRNKFLKIIGGGGEQDSVDETAVKPNVACDKCGGFSQAECSYICGSRGFPYYYCENCECLCHYGVYDPTN